jgi:hypothetical protein
MRLITVNENPTARPIQVMPLVVACMKLTKPKKTQTASQPTFEILISNGILPWSNNCPRGDDEPVLLACFPSTASSV